MEEQPELSLWRKKRREDNKFLQLLCLILNQHDAPINYKAIIEAWRKSSKPSNTHVSLLTYDLSLTVKHCSQLWKRG
jgi:hypothetical protein